MSYQTVFEVDVLAAALELLPLMLLPTSMVLGGSIVLARAGGLSRRGWVFTVAGSFFFQLFVLAIAYRTIEAVQARAAYDEGRAEVVEGRIHVLRTEPRGGHAPGDLIEIDGRRVELEGPGPGYSTPIVHGGVLQEGVQARLYLVDDVILRVDVAREHDPGQL